MRACAASDKTFRDLTFWLRRALVFVNKIPHHGHTDIASKQRGMRSRREPLSEQFRVLPLMNLSNLLSFLSTDAPSICLLGSFRFYCYFEICTYLGRCAADVYSGVRAVTPQLGAFRSGGHTSEWVEEVLHGFTLHVWRGCH